MRGCRHDKIKKKTDSKKVLKPIPKNTIAGLKDWMKRCKKCGLSDRDYFEEGEIDLKILIKNLSFKNKCFLPFDHSGITIHQGTILLLRRKKTGCHS